jgi:hypothetical protein
MDWHYNDDGERTLVGHLEGSAFGIQVEVSRFWRGQPSTKMRGHFSSGARWLVCAAHVPSGARWRVCSGSEWDGFYGGSCVAFGEVRAPHDEEGWATADPMSDAMDLGEHMAKAAEAWLAERVQRPGTHVVHARLEAAPAPVEPTGPVAVLVACGRTKGRGPAPACQLYEGSLFRLRLRWAEVMHGGIAGILSSLHGLVEPNEVIRPYDLTQNNLTPQECEFWNTSVARQLLARFPAGTHLVVLAGKGYAGGWVYALRQAGRSVELRYFRGVGYERQVLTREIAEHEAGRLVSRKAAE